MESKLWYTSIPKDWIEGLPIGNGRLAAMVWGDRCSDIISLNHEWLWRGLSRDRECSQEASHLPEVRECLKRGDNFRATCLASTYFGGLGGISGLPHRTDPYQPAGDLIFTFEKCGAFTRRELDVSTGVAMAERLADGRSVRSTFIAHPRYHLIICRWCAPEGNFSGNLRYERAKDAHAREQCAYSSQGIAYSCAFDGGIEFKTAVSVRTDGEAAASGGCLSIDGATWITAYVNIGTSVKGIENELARFPVPELGWDELLKSHAQIFSAFMGRLSLNVSLPESALPTDKRIELLQAGLKDPALPLLYFNFGRYLLASSCIAGELPANLQGKWNDSIRPPWDCDYHFDINIQMTYWVAEAAGMPECIDQLLRFVESFLPSAREAAARLYGCRGIWMPETTDAWGRATPEDYGWIVWIGSAPWIAQFFWRHWEYTGDAGFLRDRAYPFFRGIALFYEDYLVADDAGVLQIMPSQSPENRFEGTGMWPVSICVSSAMDVQLAYDALSYAIRSSAILGVDADSRKKWEAMRDSLPPFRIGSDGRLLEWDRERVEMEPGHRHLSHLYGLYPSDLFNPLDRPAQYAAAIKSLEFRLAQGGGHTGWSRAWAACLFARIGNAKELWKHLTASLTEFASASLLDLHPVRIFQIDGNLGATEAILQSLVQCWGGKVHLLRALPAEWREGSLRGVKAPGGHTLALAWSEGKLDSVEITMGYGGSAVFSGLAGKFNLPANAEEKDGDVILSGEKGTKLLLRR